MNKTQGGYSITAFSNWVRPQYFTAETEEEKDKLVFDLKGQQFLVKVDELD